MYMIMINTERREQNYTYTHSKVPHFALYMFYVRLQYHLKLSHYMEQDGRLLPTVFAKPRAGK